MDGRLASSSGNIFATRNARELVTIPVRDEVNLILSSFCSSSRSNETVGARIGTAAHTLSVAGRGAQRAGHR
jgi:hypothetical protein